MKLRKAILLNAIKACEDEFFEEPDIESLFEKECYMLLEKIKAALEDENLDDKDCFERIERVVCLFEEIGIGCGTRHDFG